MWLRQEPVANTCVRLIAVIFCSLHHFCPRYDCPAVQRAGKYTNLFMGQEPSASTTTSGQVASMT
jgi:hypothetical protein